MGAFLRFGEMYCARTASRFEAAQAQARLGFGPGRVCMPVCVRLPFLSPPFAQPHCELLPRGTGKRVPEES